MEPCTQIQLKNSLITNNKRPAYSCVPRQTCFLPKKQCLDSQLLLDSVAMDTSILTTGNHQNNSRSDWVSIITFTAISFSPLCLPCCAFDIIQSKRPISPNVTFWDILSTDINLFSKIIFLHRCTIKESITHLIQWTHYFSRWWQLLIRNKKQFRLSLRLRWLEMTKKVYR